MLDAIQRCLGVCERVFVVLVNTCLAVMLAANMANILSRALFDSAIKWVFPWSMVLFTYLVFLGFFLFVRRGKDVTIDFIFNRFPDAGRRVLAVALNCVSMLILGVILVQAPQIIHGQVGVIEMVGLQRYMLSVPLFVSCLLIFLDILVATLRILAGGTAPKRGFLESG